MKAVIFDLDGTLLDSMRVWADVDDDFLRRFGHETPPRLQNQVSVMTMTQCAAYFRTTFGIPLTDEEIIAEWLRMAGEAYAHTVQAKPDALRFVRQCADKGLSLCVATGTFRPFALTALERLGLMPYMDFVLNVDQVGYGKDRPDIYLQCAERLGVEPKDCVVLEDVLDAARTAAGAGFPVWGVYDESSARDWEAMQTLCARTAFTLSEYCD